MNNDIFNEKKKQIRGKSKKWRGALTDDDLDVIDANREKLIRKLQKHYGYSKARAAQEFDQRLEELDRLVTLRR